MSWEWEIYHIANGSSRLISLYNLCFNDFLENSRNVRHFNIRHMPALFVSQKRYELKEAISTSVLKKFVPIFFLSIFFLHSSSLWRPKDFVLPRHAQFVLLLENSILLWNGYFMSSFFIEIRKSMFCTSTFKFYSLHQKSSRYILDTNMCVEFIYH